MKCFDRSARGAAAHPTTSPRT